jgi:hypothetical protein
MLSRVSGLSTQVIDAHCAAPDGLLPPHLRRTFCPECWVEEGLYRRRRLTNCWLFVCVRHRRLLAERPVMKPPVSRDFEDSWLAFYEARHLWHPPAPTWRDERWERICAALGVEPRAEFLRAWLWLQELGELGGLFRDCRPIEATLRTQRDLVLYALIGFHDRSVLQALDNTIPASALLQERFSGELCSIVSPEVGYDARLFAALVAMHLWERLEGRQWSCGQYQKLEAFLGQQRSQDEDWWLEKRLRGWAPHLQAAGRKLLHREAPWVLPPPWERCREVCIRFEAGIATGTHGLRLPPDWRCGWVEGKDYGVRGRRGITGGSRRVREVVY